jgi:hypothetical protein
MKYKKLEQASLQVGDCLHFIWCGDRLIVCFEEYAGPFDFVARIVVFENGGKMSLTKGNYYEILEV